LEGAADARSFGHEEGLAAIRGLVNVERLRWQLLDASP
jgi:hypothetical protein